MGMVSHIQRRGRLAYETCWETDLYLLVLSNCLYYTYIHIYIPPPTHLTSLPSHPTYPHLQNVRSPPSPRMVHLRHPRVSRRCHSIRLLPVPPLERLLRRNLRPGLHPPTPPRHPLQNLHLHDWRRPGLPRRTHRLHRTHNAAR